MRSGRRRLLLAGAIVVMGWGSVGSAIAEDTVAHLAAELSNARSFKVRVQAAYLLAKLEDPRVLPALAQALQSDRDDVVREFAAKLVANNPGGDASGHTARMALAKALHDPSEKVRRSAKGSLDVLDRNVRTLARQAGASKQLAVRSQPLAGKRFTIAVGKIADRSGRASTRLRDYARLEVMGQLKSQPSVTVTDSLESDVSYVLDGAIRKLTMSTLRGDVEQTCGVELILSRPGRGIMMVASGEASVQKPRGQYRPQQRELLEEESIKHAVRSAQENLAQFLSRQ
jgi:hypothetical protein